MLLLLHTTSKVTHRHTTHVHNTINNNINESGDHHNVSHSCCRRSEATCEIDLPSALATASNTLKVSSSMLTCHDSSSNINRQ